jgi:hypothetical protein
METKQKLMHRLVLPQNLRPGCLALLVAFALPSRSHAASHTLLGWNNLGMHCMDSDYSVFSILPPYNTIEAQLLVGGKLLVASNGFAVSYQAVADADGSINSTAIGKGNFYDWSEPLYGAAVPPDAGLLSWPMPGPENLAQPMLFETGNSGATVNWFRAEGIPITPYDDAGHKNPYPMMRLVARNAANAPVATNDIVLPVSDEMDCRACHASGSHADARPADGWVWVLNAERDYRLNILRLHDGRRDPQTYAPMLVSAGFNAAGLYRSVVVDAKPVLCAKCHLSEALPGTGLAGVPPLTASVHALHGYVVDPDLGITLDDSAHRAACYRCHPGSATKCLRGAMGAAIAPDGSMAMQCQSCHGSMSQVGAANRIGWLQEPVCQGCHTGTATSNNGQIRYTSVFSDPITGTYRAAVDQTFATRSNTPAAGVSLYRFSSGHGGLQCSACHGSTHAEFPSSHANDNVRNIALQGHSGVMVECAACHTATPNTPNRGPHGLHAIGQGWITGSDAATKHADVLAGLGGSTACQPCHGTDYRGTVLSLAQTDRVFTMNFDQGTVTMSLYRGAVVGCYTCHNGPQGDDLNTVPAPTTANISTNTLSGTPVAMQLSASSGPTTLMVVAQPQRGSVGLVNGVATYFPEPGFTGTDTFMCAAYNGSRNSLRATGTVVVAQGPYSVVAAARVPDSAPAGWPVVFGAVVTVTNLAAPAQCTWSFGDGAPSVDGHSVSHTFASPGNYAWQLTATVQGPSGPAQATRSGTITIGPPLQVAVARSGNAVALAWPHLPGDALLEWTSSLSAPRWLVETNAPKNVTGGFSVTATSTDQARFYRLRKL